MLATFDRAGVPILALSEGLSITEWETSSVVLVAWWVAQSKGWRPTWARQRLRFRLISQLVLNLIQQNICPLTAEICRYGCSLSAMRPSIKSDFNPTLYSSENDTVRNAFWTDMNLFHWTSARGTSKANDFSSWNGVYKLKGNSIRRTSKVLRQSTERRAHVLPIVNKDQQRAARKPRTSCLQLDIRQCKRCKMFQQYWKLYILNLVSFSISVIEYDYSELWRRMIRVFLFWVSIFCWFRFDTRLRSRRQYFLMAVYPLCFFRLASCLPWLLTVNCNSLPLRLLIRVIMHS